MSRKSVWIMLLVLLVGMVLAACTPATGTSENDNEDVDEPEATEAQDEETEEVEEATEEAATTEETGGEETAAEVELRWRTRPDNQEEADVYQGVSTSIDDGWDGVTLVYEPGGSESASYQDVLKTELAAGTAPDVFWIPGTDVADFATRGLILDMRSYADASDDYSDDDFYPGPMFHLTYNPETGNSGETLWGLPRDVSTFVLYLNMDLINESGAPDPRELEANGEWDWEAFMEVAEATSALGADIKGYGGNAWWGPYGVWMNSAGGGFFNDDRNACALDTAESIEGVQFMSDLYNSGYAVPYGEDAEPPFRAGSVAMFQNGRWATPGIRTVEFDWDVVGLPSGPGGGPGNWLFWGAYVVNANTEHPEEAWELVQQLTQAQVQGQISSLGTNIPSRVSQEALDAFLGFTPPANNQAFLNGLQNDPTTEGPVWEGSWPEYVTVMDTYFSQLMTGEISIEDFQANVCGEANQSFGN